MTQTPLDAAEIHRIAALAHLALTDDEVQLFGRQLGDILGYVQQIQAVPTDGVTPMSHAGRGDAHERTDAPQPTLDRRAALGNAPDAAPEAGFFKVPRSIG